MIEDLLRTYKERRERAARHSHSILRGEHKNLSGNEYETEVFNLLRAVFPYCHKLGRPGKAEPDGFVCIPDYRSVQDEGELVDASSWNFIYDAKHHGKGRGYDLNHDEQRKMLEYISTFRNQRRVLDGSNRKIRAHIIISNQVADAKMLAAAGFLFGDDGLSKKNKDVKLILMREEFLMKLFEWSQTKTEEVRTKRPYLLELFIKLFDSAPPEGFLALGEAEAQGIVAELAEYQGIEKRVPAKSLEASLDQRG